MAISRVAEKPKSICAMGLPSALAGFTFKARVDWLEFAVDLKSPSHFRHLQNRTHEVWGKVFFEPVAGTEQKTWRFRVQNPLGPDQFMRDVQLMAPPGDPVIGEDQVRVIGIEIALDAHHPTNDRQKLALATVHMMQHQAIPPGGLPRITGKHVCRVPASPHDALQALLYQSVSINIGEEGADHAVRLYVKDYDTVDGVPYIPLPPSQWRARFENTLTGKEVPFATIEGWRNFRFETLAKDRFGLVMPVQERSPLVTQLQAHSIQLGRRPDSYKIRSSDRRKRAAFTCRDSVTNDKIRQALRALSRSQFCQNSVKNLHRRDAVPEGGYGLDTESPKYLNNNQGIQVVMTDQSSMTGSKTGSPATWTPPSQPDLPPITALPLNVDAEGRKATQLGFVKKLMVRMKAVALDLLDQMDSAWHLTPN